MKTKIIVIALFVALGAGTYTLKTKYYDVKKTTVDVALMEQADELQDGDIIFQVTNSSQCEAIQQATKSKYSHCGIIFKKDGKYFVYEAIQPVTYTQLGHWIKRGVDEHYVIKRLKNADKVLTVENKKKMLAEAEKYFGKDYDLTFEWSDDRIYCSELVWKIYERGAGVKIGKLEKLKDFDLSHPAVQEKIKERYGNNMPMDELAISPASIFDSELLYTVKEN